MRNLKIVAISSLLFAPFFGCFKFEDKSIGDAQDFKEINELETPSQEKQVGLTPIPKSIEPVEEEKLSQQVQTESLQDKVVFQNPMLKRVLSPIPHLDENPHVSRAVLLGKKTVQDMDLGADYKSAILSDLELDGSSKDLTRLAELLCHPQSPMYGDTSLADPILQRLYMGLNSTKNREGQYSFGTTDLFRTYMILLYARPDLLSEDYIAFAEETFHQVANKLIEEKPEFFRSGATGSWVNGDIRYIEILMWAGILFEDDRYTTHWQKGLEYVSRSLLKDGGFLYVGNVNEPFTYHAEIIVPLAEMHQFGGSELAKELIEKSRPFYPLSIEPPGVAEYSMAACWKPYWNQSRNPDGAMIVADYTNCSYNNHVAQSPTMKSTLFLASFYRPDLETAVEDNYFVYDHNIGGPRGRFGDWSFSGTARPYGDKEFRGKGSIAGCMILNEDVQGQFGKWNLNAAMHEAGVEIRSKSARSGYGRYSHHTSHGGDRYHSLTYNDQNGYAVASDFSVLGSVYKLGKYKSENIMPCTGRQTWIYTPNRIVGLLEISPDEDLRAFSLSATLRLVSGRAFWGERKTVEQVEEGFRYGKLRIRIHENTFSDEAAIRYEETYSGDREKTGRISFLDAKGLAGNEMKRNLYKKGERYHILVEVFPEDHKPANRVQLAINEESLKAFSVVEGEAEYRVYHNTTAESSVISVPLVDTMKLVQNGYQHRPNWDFLDPYEGNQEGLISQLSIGKHELTLEPYGVLVLKSK